MRIGLPLIDPLTMAATQWTEAGPDLAFIKVPNSLVSELENYANVLSLDRQLEQRNAVELIGTVSGELVAGVIDEWTGAPVVVERTKAIMHNCLLNTGSTEPLPPESDYDRLKFVPDPTEMDRPPESYAGSSGGGLWRIWIRQEDGGHTSLADRRLIGVAYYEVPTASGSLNIVCHGPASLYERLISAISGEMAGQQAPCGLTTRREADLRTAAREFDLLASRQISCSS